MKIHFYWPFLNQNEPQSDTTESYEFYNVLEKDEDIELVSTFDEADYIIFMMDLYMKDVDNFKSDRFDHKTVIIDYNDWTDTRNVPKHKLSNIRKYFKRSVVEKEGGISKKLIEYPREVIPISYGIRSDFIKQDEQFELQGYKYDICCMFNGGGGFRSTIPAIVRKSVGRKHVGRVDCPNRYGVVSKGYFEILKTSKIIVTANPPNWEGDFRLWEALLMGNLVICDKMLAPSIMKYPLKNKQHLVYYSSLRDLADLINYYMNNDEEREKIGKEGRDYCLKHHKFADRVSEVLEVLRL